MSVLISGSQKGLGKFLADKYLSESLEVVTHSRSDTNAFEKELGLDHISCDLENVHAILSEMKRLKTQNIEIKHLVCNAGKSSYQSAYPDNILAIRAGVENNLFVVTNLIYAVLLHFPESLKTVTVIGSICGEEIINGAPLEYSVAKSSLKSFVKMVSYQMAENGIRINLVSPGNLKFPGSVWQKKSNEEAKSVKIYLENNVPLRDLVDAEEIFHMVKYLQSNAARSITGANIVIDGGQLKRW